jgi:glutathione peroxidase
MLKLFSFATLLVLSWSVSIYTFTSNGINNQEINFNDFRGKKILIVNIATSGEHIQQLAELEQLYQQYQDSLVVVAFPSNSFGNESHSNAELLTIIQNTYHLSFPVSELVSVTGEEAHAVYRWIASQDDNGVLHSTVKEDFKKYLISSTGNIIGIFAGQVSPLDTKLTNAVMAEL